MESSRITKVIQQSSGQVLVLFGILVIVFSLFCILAFDLGVLALEKAKHGAATDAAALAGANTYLLAKQAGDLDTVAKSKAETKAREVFYHNYLEETAYATLQSNPASLAAVGDFDQMTFDVSNLQMVVHSRREQETYFARLWGVFAPDVLNQAVAKVGAISRYASTKPFVLTDMDAYNLEDDMPDIVAYYDPNKDIIGSGNCLLLNFNSTDIFANDLGNTNVKNYILSDSLELSITDTAAIELKTAPGNKKGQVVQALGSIFDQCEALCGIAPSSADYTDHTKHQPNCPRFFVVPATEEIISISGSKFIQITGFVTMFLLDEPKNGAGKPPANAQIVDSVPLKDYSVSEQAKNYGTGAAYLSQ